MGAVNRRPPVVGWATPVVVGRLSGNPARERMARKAKAWASSASPFQPARSTGSTGAAVIADRLAMITGLWRPPPVTSQRLGGAGR